MATPASVVYVIFSNPQLDLSWIPPDAAVVIVHNDGSLDPTAYTQRRVRHVFSNRNIGFGAGVNLALAHVDTERVVLCNPDTSLSPEHWSALVEAKAEELVSLPIVEPGGRPTAVVNRYPTATSLLLTGWRVGRLLKRGGAPRRALTRLLGKWGREHDSLLGASGGEWPLSEYWASAAVLSVDTARLRAVEGFDNAYFLYFEDVDLCRRLSRRFPDMVLRIPKTSPAVHQVRGSASGEGSRNVDRHHLASARRWGRTRSGWKWRAVDLALTPRSWWLERKR